MSCVRCTVTLYRYQRYQYQYQYRVYRVFGIYLSFIKICKLHVPMVRIYIFVLLRLNLNTFKKECTQLGFV